MAMFVAAAQRRGAWVRLDLHGPAWQPEADLQAVVRKIRELPTNRTLGVLNAETNALVWSEAEPHAAPPTTLF